MKVVNVVDEFHPYAGYENNVLSKYMVKYGYEYTILTSSFEQDQKYYVDFLGVNDIEKKDAQFEKETGVKIERVRIKKFISGRAIWKYSVFMK